VDSSTPARLRRPLRCRTRSGGQWINAMNGT
jgi:hypothetical protein